MNTVKLLIEIPEKEYNRIKDQEEVTYAELFIANGTPITDDIISCSELKETLTKLGWTAENGFDKRYVLDDIIDNIKFISDSLKGGVE